MYPVICQIGPVHVYSYGVMMAVAVIICSLLLSKDAPRAGLKPDQIFDFMFWVVLGGIIGARIFFILLNLSYFLSNPSEIFKVYHGGLAWQGGLMAGIVVSWLYIRRKGWALLPTLDFLAPYIALGQAIGRIGCFLNGCCYGREVAWGIYSPAQDATLHPTQLYDSIGLLIIFFILRRYGWVSQKAGQVFTAYLLLASAQRFVIEFFRADHGILWVGLSIFQVISLLVFVAAVYFNLYIRFR